MDLNLSQRTIVILGPVKATLQNLVMALAQEGADIGLVDAGADQLQRFCQNISDQREIKDKFGRAMAVKADMTSWSSVKDAMGKVAQSFGSVDILIDAMSSSTPTAFAVSGDDTVIDTVIAQNLSISLKAAQYASGFMKGRKRGRIVFLNFDTFNRGVIEDATATAARAGLIAFSKSLSRQLQDVHVTVNCVSLGLTEEYLMGHFPDAGSTKDAFEKMKAIEPSMKLADSEKIANSIIYLCSSAGASVAGQHLVLS